MTSPGRAWLLAAVAAYLLLSLGWLVWTPALEAADESTHLQYALHIAQAGELPVVRGTAKGLGLQPWDEETQAFHPPLYYAAVAGLTHLLGRADTIASLRVNGNLGQTALGPSSALQYLHGYDERAPWGPGFRVLQTLRGATVLVGLLVVLLTFALGRRAFPGDPALAGLAALLVASVPRFVHEVASVHNETLVAALAHLALFVLVAARPAGAPGPGRALLLGLVVGLALLTKLTGLMLLPLVALGCLLPALRGRRWPAARELLSLLIVVGVAAAVSGWWFARNQRLYGDPLALAPLRALFPTISHDAGGAATWLMGEFVPTFLGSFVGYFGWFAVRPHPAALAAAAALVLAAALGWVLRARGRGASPPAERDALWLLVAAVLLALAQLVAYNLSVTGPDCRYVFVALGPAAILAAAGLLACWRALTAGRGGALRVAGALLVAALPLGSGALLVFQARPALRAEHAPSGRFHAALVTGVSTPVAQPSITLTSPPDGALLERPPVLQWSPGARADESVPYTLDFVLPGGQPLVSTFDQFAVEIRGERFPLPPVFWNFLPEGVPVQWRVRLVPDRERGQTELDAPASEFRTLTRQAR
jgi:4-amino-4-deoxy-L-arabinose transferase-like glycosyltransferase